MKKMVIVLSSGLWILSKTELIQFGFVRVIMAVLLWGLVLALFYLALDCLGEITREIRWDD